MHTITYRMEKNRVPLHNIENYIHILVINHSGNEYEKEDYIHYLMINYYGKEHGYETIMEKNMENENNMQI